MTNEYNFKEGDNVMLASDANAVGVVRFVGKESCIVDFGLGDSTTAIKDLVLIDSKTAFLRELQALLRKYDAKISYDTQCDKFEIYFCDGDKIVDSIFYPLKYPEFIENEYDDIGHLNLAADNIMDFDKE